jgi:hypothetical protein
MHGEELRICAPHSSCSDKRITGSAGNVAYIGGITEVHTGF